MSQDQQTYIRATTATLIGLATQLVLTVLVAILGFYAGSKALIAGAFYLIPGIWIWALLWVLYKQHRLERDESLEAAALADADARSAALFDEAGAQLAQAKRRLENIYKWALPIGSIVTALYLLGVGVLLLYLNNSALSDGSLSKTPVKEGINTELVALLLVIGAMGGFLVARYVAGMTRVDAWQALRGGASTLIGNVFLGVLPLLVAAALSFFDNNLGFIYLPLVLPGIMVLLGIEIALALVLGFYRPRKAGEFVRPAFDSRVLGWLTRPESIGKIFSETLNYQFGFEVSKSWFMRLLGKALLPLAAACVAIVIAMSCVVVVQPHQQAVVTYGGAFVRVAEPGLSFKAPWPLGKAEKYDVQRVQSFRLGSRAHIEHKDDMATKAILWTNQHVEEGEKEEFLITAPQIGNGLEGKGEVLGEMIGADIDISYRISDLREYVGVDSPRGGAADPVELLKSITQNKVTRYFASNNTDSLLKSGRASAGQDIRQAIQRELDQHKVGITVVFVSVSGLHPPQDVADEYHARINAVQEKETARERAEQDAEVILATAAGSGDQAQKLIKLMQTYYETDAKMIKLPQEDPGRKTLQAELDKQVKEIELLMISSGGAVGQSLSQARATRWAVSLQEQSRYVLRKADMDAYRVTPRYYKATMFFDVLVEGLEDRPKTILGPPMDAEKDVNVVLDLPQIAVPGGIGQ